MAEMLTRVLLATFVLAALAWGTATVIGYATPGKAIIATTAALLVGGAGFLGMLQLLHVSELSLLYDAIRRRPLSAADEAL